MKSNPPKYLSAKVTPGPLESLSERYKPRVGNDSSTRNSYPSAKLRSDEHLRWNLRRPSDVPKERQKKRFPFEIFSAGSLGQRKQIVAVPEEMNSRQGSVVRTLRRKDEPLHRAPSIPELSAPGHRHSSSQEDPVVTFEEMRQLKRDCTNIMRSQYPTGMLPRNYDGSFLPNIRPSDRLTLDQRSPGLLPWLGDTLDSGHGKGPDSGTPNGYLHSREMQESAEGNIYSDFLKTLSLRKGSCGGCQLANLELLSSPRTKAELAIPPYKSLKESASNKLALNSKEVQHHPVRVKLQPLNRNVLMRESTETESTPTASPGTTTKATPTVAATIKTEAEPEKPPPAMPLRQLKAQSSEGVDTSDPFYCTAQFSKEGAPTDVLNPGARAQAMGLEENTGQTRSKVSPSQHISKQQVRTHAKSHATEQHDTKVVNVTFGEQDPPLSQ